MKQRNFTIILLGIFILYILVSLFYFSESHRSDEKRYLMFADNILHGFYSPERLNIWNGPGYPLILSLFVPLGKKMMVLLNPIFMILGVFFFNKALKAMNLGDKIANLVTILLALFPFMFYYLPLVMTECFTFFLVCCTLLTSIQYFKTRQFKTLILLSVSVCFLALTKVIFFYALLILMLLGLIISLIKKKLGFLLFRVGLLSFLLASPWLIYTYSLTGKMLYLSNAGGTSLYWMSTPYAQEYGDWHSFKYSKKALANYDEDWNKLYGAKLAENHVAFTSKIQQLPPLERDERLYAAGIQNIKRAPLKYTKNVIYNIGRMWFLVPFSYTPHQPGLLFRIVYISFVFVFFSGTILWILYIQSLPEELILCTSLFMAYLALSSLVSAFPRMLDVVMPFIFLLIAWAVNEVVKHIKQC